jgi:hypothetical protein
MSLWGRVERALSKLRRHVGFWTLLNTACAVVWFVFWDDPATHPDKDGSSEIVSLWIIM